MATLAAVYRLEEWRRLVALVTAFTVGHSATLALATLDLLRVDGRVVETLIPVTIVLAAAVNVVEWRRRAADGWSRAEPVPHFGAGKYALALVFGLVHGLGFSSFLRALLGGEAALAVPLLGFNLGLEAGQLLVVAAVLLLSALVTRGLALARRDWVLLLSGATAGIAGTMILERAVG